jgi:TolB-like protein/DNA-binding winged helix-turn-helix (wHTH) protein
VATDVGGAQESVTFGQDFELDLRAYKLCRAGHALRLERIPMELLRLLLEQPGKLVTRDEIVERIWGKEVFLDTDNSINGAIRKIRQVLKDDCEQPRYVQTVTGSGYRFVALVTSVHHDTPKPVPEPPEPAVAPATMNDAAIVRLASRRWLAAGCLAVGLLAVLVAFLLALRGAPARQRTGRVMLAVLPFENLTGDQSQEYFSDGLTEEMITQLGRLDPQRLGLIARTSVMRYKRGAVQVAEIGGALGVQYVLEGSVRRGSNRVRIAAQLIQVRDQTHLWSREYDREETDLLNVQGEIAQAVADEVRITLADPPTAAAGRRAALSRHRYEAYDLYLKGRYFWNKRTPQGFDRAIEAFQQATVNDPDYAPGYAGLADTYALIGLYNLAPQIDVIPKSRAAALKALQLDDGLAEAHTSLALISEQYDWNWRTAEHEFQRAIELNPNNVTAHHWYAECLAFQGRFDDALAESERARQLDPLSLIIASDNGAILYFSRRYDRAIKRFRGVLEMEPNFGRAHLIVGAYEQNEDWADALAHIDDWRRMEDGPWTWAWAVHVYGRAGRREDALRALEKLNESNQRWKLNAPALMSMAYAGMGDKDEAIAWLNQGLSEHSSAVVTLKVDPAYDPLRGDPRFEMLLRRVGLSP